MENDDKLDILQKTDDSDSTAKSENSKKYIDSKRAIIRICKSFEESTDQYSPEETIKLIETYLNLSDKSDKVGRIPYSEISSYMLNLGDDQRAVLLTNVEKLFVYSLDDTSISDLDNVSRVIAKIYDHIQLVNYQIGGMNDIFAQRIVDAKVDLRKEIKAIEKEYISILGIFAAIVLAFVGGITFSTSVLQNVGNASIYRLLLIVVLLAFVLMNVIWLLVKFIIFINDKEANIFNVRRFNILCGAIALAIVMAWILNMQSFAEFVGKYLPW